MKPLKLVVATCLLGVLLATAGCSSAAPAPTAAPAAQPTGAAAAPAAPTAAAAPAAATKAPATSNAAPLKVGLVFAQTGYMAGADRSLSNGAQLAIDYVNANGGINGRKIEAYSEDMKSQPADAAAAATKLVTQTGVNALMSGFVSAGAEAEAPIAADKNIPLLVYCLLPKDPKTTFGFLAAPNYQLTTAFQFLKAQGITKIGLLSNQSPYNQALAGMASNLASAAGVTIVDAETHAVDATSLSVQLTKIKDQNPQAVMTVASGASSLLTAKDMTSLGMSSLPLLLSGGDENAVIKQVAGSYKNSYAVVSGLQPYPEMDAAQKAQADIFVPLYKQKYPDLDPANAGFAWDMVQALVQASKATNGDDAKLVSALTTVSLPNGATGAYQLSADNHNAVRSNPWKVAQVQGDVMKVVFSPK